MSADGPYFSDGHNTDAIILDNIIHNDDHQLHEIMKTKKSDKESSSYTIVVDQGCKTCVNHDNYDYILPHSVTKEEEQIKDDALKPKTKKVKKPLTPPEALHNLFALYLCTIKCVDVY